MHHTKRNRTIALLMSAQLVALGFVQPATAGVVSTETAIELSQREATIERIDAVLARDTVQRQLEAFGVDPADARTRIAHLSDSELATLEERMNTLPAGANGALEVLGIVLLVLLVLELVGVTDIFKSL
jgi:hypothetical protein